MAAGGAPWGGRVIMGRGVGLASYGLPVAAARSLLVVRAAVREGEEKEEREKKRKGRKRKEKKKKTNMEKNSNLKISEK
jgi:hypothetical protein